LPQGHVLEAKFMKNKANVGGFLKPDINIMNLVLDKFKYLCIIVQVKQDKHSHFEGSY
jgi:hypothetical protein